jgi:hypothetical protein
MVVVGHSAVDITPGLIRDAPIVNGKGVIGIKLDRPVVVGDGAAEVALGCVGIAAVAEGTGVIGIQRYRPGESAIASS